MCGVSSPLVSRVWLKSPVFVPHTSETKQGPLMRALHYTFLVAIVLVATQAQARWKPEYGKANPKIGEWYGKQHNQKGEWCCDNSDGHPYYGGVKFLADGGVELDGGWKLPAYMVLKGANPTGHAVWWFVDNEGTRTNYCFHLGTLS
jgi:hypothetical protein